MIPAWPQESYATHGIANQAFYLLDLASLLQGAAALDTLAVRSPTSRSLKVKGLPLAWSLKTERRNFPFPPLRGTPGTGTTGMVQTAIAA